MKTSAPPGPPLLKQALVLHFAAQPECGGKFSFFGCNPGLVAHSALRDKVHGGGCLGGCIEGLMSVFTPCATRMLPVMLVPGLEDASGTMLGQGATPIIPAEVFRDEAKASAVIADAQALITYKIR